MEDKDKPVSKDKVDPAPRESGRLEQTGVFWTRQDPSTQERTAAVVAEPNQAGQP